MASAGSAEAPLMAHQEGAFDDDDDGSDNGIFSDPAGAGDGAKKDYASPQSTARLGPFVWLLTAAAGISGLLFGYDTGVISATLVSIGTSLSGRALTDLDKSVITSVTALAALVASPLASVVADRLGRRPVILVADVLFVAGALAQAAARTVSQMVVGRAVVGAGVGAASFVTPLYLAELAPAAHRGRVVTMNVLSITLGQVVAYVAGWLFAARGDPATAWRYLVGLGAVPALAQCALLALMLPETPRWLVGAGRPGEARAVIRKTTAGSAAGADPDPDPAAPILAVVDRTLRDIEAEVAAERDAADVAHADAASWLRWSAPWHELLKAPRNRRALAIACLLQGLQQLCGFNSLMYFSATIFSILGFSVPTLTSLSVAVTNFVFTAAALLLIDRIGRRRVLLYSIPFMVLGLLLSAFGFRLSANMSAADTTARVAESESESARGRGSAVLILISMMVYVAAFALGLGNVPWMQSELFPLNVRSLGSGLATATNWLANFVVGLTFLPLMDSLTPTWTFALYAAVCGAGWAAVWLIYPETVGLSLEEATGLLEHGWGVR
ncbi:general substrate transporter [Xylariaceae sp. FL0804]|nr:general substrate transporter [Xylariaceae sp. FL0804]